MPGRPIGRAATLIFGHESPLDSDTQRGYESNRNLRGSAQVLAHFGETGRSTFALSRDWKGCKAPLLLAGPNQGAGRQSYLQTTFPKASLYMNEGTQKPVLTLTKAAPTSNQPTM